MKLPGAVEDVSLLEISHERLADCDKALEGYLAKPRDRQARTGLLVMHDIFGVGAHYPDLARRFANLGYAAFVPNMYWRTGDPNAADPKDLYAKHFGMNDRDVMADVSAAARHLRERHGVTQVAAIGFCCGGRWVLLAASGERTLDVAIDCWGGHVTSATPKGERTTPERPVPVIEMASTLHCPLLIVAGVEDPHPTPEEVREYERALRAHGKDVTVRFYEGAGHAFMNDTRAFYREAPAFQAWDDINAFLRGRLPA